MCVDWLLCESCLEALKECLEGLEKGFEEPSSSTPHLHLGSTAWKRTVEVRCLSGAEAYETEITVEKKVGSALEQGHGLTMFDTYIVWIDGAIRGMLNIPEAEKYDAAVWGIHLADMLGCDNVVAVNGSDFGQLFSSV